MPFSYPCPGVERNVIALACAAMTESAIVPQRMRFVAVQIMSEIVIAPRAPVTVDRDRQQRAEEHDVIDPDHEK